MGLVFFLEDHASIEVAIELGYYLDIAIYGTS